MGETNLTCMPLEILEVILCKVSASSVRDVASAKIAFQGFNSVGSSTNFYRSAPQFLSRYWYDTHDAEDTFRRRCYAAQNPESLYMRGIYEYFRLHLLAEGRAKIRDSGLKGFELGTFVDGMLELAFSVDESGRVHNYPPFTRAFVDRMSLLMNRSENSGSFDYERPQEFTAIADKINPNTSYSCWCSEIRPFRYVYKLNGAKDIWECDDCFWQYEAWTFCDDIWITRNYWPNLM